MYTKFKGIRNFSFRNTRVTRKTCPMLTIKIDLPTSIWCLYSWIWTEFTHCSDVSIVDFDKVNARWVSLLKKFSLFFMKTIWTWPLIGRFLNWATYFINIKEKRNIIFLSNALFWNELSLLIRSIVKFGLNSFTLVTWK